MARPCALPHRIIGLTFAALLNASSLDPAQAFTGEEVVAAWKLHSGRINSIDYKATQNRKEKVYEPTLGDEQGRRGAEADVSPVVLIGHLRFIKSNNRLAFQRSSEVWNSLARRKVVLRQHFCFDGTRNLSYVQGIPASCGQITPSKTADAQLIGNVETIPIWWAHFPASQISQAGDFSVDDMKITEQQDQTRIALEVVSRSNKELFYFLRVDATNGFRINKVKLEHQGRKLLDLDIEYVADDEVGWRIAAWDCASIDGLHISTEVDECRVNENVPDESFVVEFPAGTEMVPSREFQFLPEKYQKDKKK